jgi:hypothetical protein
MDGYPVSAGLLGTCSNSSTSRVIGSMQEPLPALPLSSAQARCVLAGRAQGGDRSDGRQKQAPGRSLRPRRSNTEAADGTGPSRDVPARDHPGDHWLELRTRVDNVSACGSSFAAFHRPLASWIYRMSLAPDTARGGPRIHRRARPREHAARSRPSCRDATVTPGETARESR